MAESVTKRGASVCGRFLLPGLSRACGMRLRVRNQRKGENRNVSKCIALSCYEGEVGVHVRINIINKKSFLAIK
ncbi:hypothetical protein Nmel_011677, partial [Mimus melanotis]